MNAFCATHGLHGVIAARRGTAPLLDVWRPNDPANPAEEALVWNQTVLDYICENEIKNVVLVCRWSINLLGKPNKKPEPFLLADKNKTEATFATARNALSNGLDRTLNKLRQCGARIVILKQVPLQTQSPQRSIVLSVLINQGIPKGISVREHDSRQSLANSIIDAQVNGRIGVATVDTRDAFFGINDHSLVGTEQGSYYRDENHLSDLGARELVLPILHPFLIESRDARRIDVRTK